MFTGLTAWFSASIGQRKKQKWLDHGGVEVPLDDAEYIFSSDAGCEDTERIFASEPYLDEHLAVFHPNYIDECLKQGDPKAGLLGKYFLPPKDVQKLLREQVTLQWDVDGHTSDSDMPTARSKQPDQSKPGTTAKHKERPHSNQPKPQSEPQATTSKQVSRQQTHHQAQTIRQNQNKSNTVTREEVQHQEEQEYLRLEDLAKSSGELMDFVPGRDGCDMVIG